MSSGKKARGRSQAATLSSGGGGRIGALPDALLHHILSFLPAQQAVQTCVLARRWLHLWKSATGVRIVGADDGEESAAPFEEVRVFVDNLLLLRGCSPLETLELRFSGDSSMDLPRIRLWIRHAVLCKVQVLQFKIFGAPALFEPDNPPLVSEHLTRVELRGIVFNDNTFLDFSRCPSLLDLHIEVCHITNAKSISSKSLKHLTITQGSFSYSSRTRIHAPNLLSLDLHVVWGRIPLLERMPSLVWAVVTVSSLCLDTCYYRPDYGDCGEESCDGCMQDDSSTVLLQGLSQAKRLSLTAATRTYIIRRDLKNCPTFSRLKTLVLNEYWCVPDIHALKCILEHSPILEELCLLLFSKGPKHKVEMKGWLNAKDLSCAIYAHLKRVEVKCEVVDDRVLKVLRFLSKLNLCFSFKEMGV